LEIWPTGDENHFSAGHRRCRRKLDAHTRAGALIPSDDRKLRTMQPRDFRDDGEPKPTPLAASIPPAKEPLSDTLALAGRYAGSSIDDFEERRVAGNATPNRDRTAGWRMRHRIVDEIAQQLLQKPRRPEHNSRLRFSAQIDAAEIAPSR
jgi:hypothetical protein